MAKTEQKIVRSEQQWRADLTPEQYEVLRRKGTERAFTGKYHDTTEAGTYLCAGCGTEVFRADDKFDAGCGWPSYTKAADAEAIELAEDRSHFMTRTEVMCARCGGHLGHVFPDGPGPTGDRFCINSASLDFKAEGE